MSALPPLTRYKTLHHVWCFAEIASETEHRINFEPDTRFVLASEAEAREQQLQDEIERLRAQIAQLCSDRADSA